MSQKDSLNYVTGTLLIVSFIHISKEMYVSTKDRNWIEGVKKKKKGIFDEAL